MRYPCQKRYYPDQVAALLELSKIQREKRPSAREVRAYRCPRCRGWHLTSRPETLAHHGPTIYVSAGGK